MRGSEAGLDIGVIDRARSLGELLALLFTMSDHWKPKEIADALGDFEPSLTIEPNTVGRWLRNERRPSKQHLQLMIRYFQLKGLIGPSRNTDRVFIRIAAHMAGIATPIAPDDIGPLIASARRASESSRLRATRYLNETQAAQALDRDLASAAADWTAFKPSPTVVEFIEQLTPQSSARSPLAELQPRPETKRQNIFVRLFVPEDEKQRSRDTGEDAKGIPFLKRFTVFNAAQCEGLPD